MEVAEQDCGLAAGDDENDEHEEKKSVHIIDLTGPDAVQHEEQLDEDTAEGENSTHNDARNRLQYNVITSDSSAVLTWV